MARRLNCALNWENAGHAPNGVYLPNTLTRALCLASLLLLQWDWIQRPVAISHTRVRFAPAAHNRSTLGFSYSATFTYLIYSTNAMHSCCVSM
jgi:hypothetical protein